MQVRVLLQCLVLFTGVGGLPSIAQALCLNNTIELRSDVDDGSYFHSQLIQTTIRPQEQFRTLDGQTWLGNKPSPTPGSQLSPTYTLAWSIEVHYSDETVDTLGQWKHSTLTGNRYGVLNGKHVPEGIDLDYPPTFRSQANTHLSIALNDRSAEWDQLNILIDDVLQDRKGNSVPGYDAINRKAPPVEVIGKLSKWIKNKRLNVLMDGGSNVDGFIHPIDFMAEAPSYCQGAASTLATMAAQLNIPARLGETNDHSWVEVQIDGQWRFVENQPETFLDVLDPPVPVWTYPKNGKETRGYQPKSEDDSWDALDREALLDGGLIDIIAEPNRFGFYDSHARYNWFFDWSNPYVYGLDGEVLGGSAALSLRPESYSDSVFNYYSCNYKGKHNSSQCGESGRQFAIAQWYSSVWELAALYPGRQNDQPYVFAKDQGDDPNIMFLTPIRGNSANNSYLHQAKVKAGNGVRKQFFLSDVEGVDAIYAVLYLGPDGQIDKTISNDGGQWYYVINGHKVSLSAANGLSPGSSKSNGIETNYLGLGQTVLRYKLDSEHLNSGHESCAK